MLGAGARIMCIYVYSLVNKQRTGSFSVFKNAIKKGRKRNVV